MEAEARSVELEGRLICEHDDEVTVVRRHLSRHIELTRAESGCLHFEVEQSDDPLVWSVSERFVSQAAFDMHQARVEASDWGRATASIKRDYVIRVETGSPGADRIGGMAWKAMGPDEVCDVIDFLDSVPWPLSRPEVHRLAAERFGWEIEESRGEEYLVNRVSCLSEADVSVVSGREYAMEVTMCATDVVRDVTEESRRFLADAHALLVREGEARWGAPRIKRDSERQHASWDTGAGGRVRFSGSARSVRVSYRTPQDMKLERDLRR